MSFTRKIPIGTFYFLLLPPSPMFAITKCKFCVDVVVYGGPKQQHRRSLRRVLLIMIVERLIKIHRYPIYLHYSLLQMCVELKTFSFFVTENPPIFHFHPRYFFREVFFNVVFEREKIWQFKFSPKNNARRQWKAD